MARYREEDVFEKLTGRQIQQVNLNQSREVFTIECADGYAIDFGVEGDCCSSSWIEHLEIPPDYVGSRIVEVVEDWFGFKLESKDHECLKQYHTRFVTDRGEIALEYRNSSNGYYGGYLVVLDEREPA